MNFYEYEFLETKNFFYDKTLHNFLKSLKKFRKPFSLEENLSRNKNN